MAPTALINPEKSSMSLRCLIVLAGLGWTLAQGRVEAHFLFVRITPHAEGGRAAEVYFSELAEAGDPRFIHRVAHTQMWMQRTPGSFEALRVHEAPDRLRAWLPVTGSVVVVGECRYGVLGRSNQPKFLLRHFPKAIAGNPEELNRMKPYGKLPLEIVATCREEGVQLMVLKDGKPVPKAEFITVDAKLANTQVTADEEGKAFWKPTAHGDYSVYTRDSRKEPGEHSGKKYEEIRDFATIALTWPLERKDADAGAVALFEEAMSARASWQDFPGFQARVTGNLDGRKFRGKVTITAKGDLEFTDDDAGPQV
jgi:hypothetical protein